MASPRFAPTVNIAAADMTKWIDQRYNPGDYVKPDSKPSTDLVDPGQIRKN